MEDARFRRFRATVAEKESDSHRSVLAKRPRNDYEYDYTYDRALPGSYLNLREDLRLAERGGNRVGVHLLDDDLRASAPPFIDDRRIVSKTGPLPSSIPLTVDEGLNTRSDSHRLDPLIGRRGAVDDLHYLPEDASNTLFVVGVPSDCTGREAAHIFRPFRGFREVRVVKKYKESKTSHRGGEGEVASAVVVLCFVEFDNPKCAATAMESLQSYRIDENDRDSPSLKWQFAVSSNTRNRDRNRSYFAQDEERDRDYYRHRR